MSSMSMTLHHENDISDLRLVSTDYAVGLPLVHEGLYSYVCHMPARPTPSIPMALPPFSNDTAVKVFRAGDGWEELPALLLNYYASQPAAFVHKHITPFMFVDVHEVSTRQGTRSTRAMVTTWYSQGDILTYLRGQLSASKITLAVQASKALAHLHNFDVVHGNIHPGNIFITDEGNATITDVSVHTFASQALLRLRPDAPFSPHGSSVYQSPELLSAGTGTFVERTRAMDVYSFALTTLAIFTGRVPSGGLDPELGVAGDLLGEFRNKSICDELLQLLQACLVRDPASRPSMSEVADKLDDLEIYHSFDHRIPGVSPS